MVYLPKSFIYHVSYTGFKKFGVLNDLVNWYSLHTVSMVQCSPAYMQGTSPLKGQISVVCHLTFF